jgi:N-acetylmuramate 1-kinase
MHSDPRLELVRSWLAQSHPEGWTLEPASADASFRRYFRARSPEGRSLIVMDAPPDREDCRPFVKVAGLLAEAGLNVPAIIRQDTDQGLLLLSDLGTTGYLGALNAQTADRLFSDALQALIGLQAASRPGVLPEYDRALLLRELRLFPEWYLQRHLGMAADHPAAACLEPLFERIIDEVLAQPRVFVHRDFMPRNLMVSAPNPGILDFQDAVFGPITYDVACLFRDAFISWPEAQVLDWVIRYWEKARAAGLPVGSDFGAFYRDLEWMGLQRHLKVLGIFARLAYRDGKPGYLKDEQRFLDYITPVAARYDALAPLARLLDTIARERAAAGHAAAEQP